MKYYIIAGEASGDLHGANLIRAIKQKDSNANIQCWGGDFMQAAGGNVVKHYRDLAFMGFVEVIANLRTILANIRFCKNDITQFKPDVLVLIDYPGFNLRIAKWAKENHIKVAYYIAPQVWAWKENRVIEMKKNIDRLMCILPFEKKYFKEKWDWEVDYVGHPLMQVIAAAKENNKKLDLPTPLVALLPGSRKQEILKKLPVMLSVMDAFPGVHFGVAQAPGIDEAWFQSLIPSNKHIHIIKGNTYGLLLHANAALVTSGTATLETALLGIPEVVCYKGNPITLALAKRFVKIKFIALVNLIMNKEVVKELIQEDCNTKQLTIALNAILTDQEKMAQIQSDYVQLQEALTTGKNASDEAASIVIALATTNEEHE